MRQQEHLVTWPEVIYDRRGTSDVAGRPLTYRRLRCMDCDWTGTTRTYAEAVELRTEHELFFTLAAGLTDLAPAAAGTLSLAGSLRGVGHWSNHPGSSTSRQDRP